MLKLSKFTKAKHPPPFTSKKFKDPQNDKKEIEDLQFFFIKTKHPPKFTK
jgi:hypothetical protein